MTKRVELTPRQYQVYDAIRNQLAPRAIAEQLGISPQRVDQVRAELRNLGLIRLRGDLPAHGRYGDVYPWQITQDVTVALAQHLIPRARFRLVYPKDSTRDVTVAPIRQLWWPDPQPRYSVQGIRMAHPEGKNPKDALPEHMVVVVTDLATGAHWSRVVPVRRVWREQDTHSWLGVTDRDREPMTLLIAAAIGVESVFDYEGE